MELHIFDRLKAGQVVRFTDPDYHEIFAVVNKTMALNQQLNSSTSVEAARETLSEIVGAAVDPSTTVFVPFHTNFGRFIELGKNVFINHGCTFLDLGGIKVEDDVMIGPQVCVVTENHPLNPADRKALVTKPITIKRNAWIGANATILPGVMIGENSVVAAGAVVSKDVPPNTVVAGVPAKVIKSLDESSNVHN
eukprot:gene3308-2440_t